MGTKERYARVAAEVADVCREAGRNPDEVVLIAVSKTVGVDGVAQAIEGGAQDFGENRPDQLVEKADCYPDVRWHFIGNIQSRRIRDIVGRATLIHSLFEERHARKIDEAAARLGIVQDVLIEVNVSGEQSKQGISPDEAYGLLAFCEGLEHMRVRGLMCMAPQGDPSVARQTFADAAALFAHLKETLSADDASVFTELSCGMSEDWREAIPEGATMVRVGRAIFSDLFEG